MRALGAALAAFLLWTATTHPKQEFRYEYPRATWHADHQKG